MVFRGFDLFSYNIISVCIAHLFYIRLYRNNQNSSKQEVIKRLYVINFRDIDVCVGV